MTRAHEDGGVGDPGVLLIRGDPAALDAFAHGVQGAGQAAGQTLSAYNTTMMALADQPVDPIVDLPGNRLFDVVARFQAVEDAVDAATLFAQALHQLDASGDGQLDAIDGLDEALLDLYLTAKQGNPAYEPDGIDLPTLLGEIAAQNGLPNDPEKIKDQLDELLAAGLIDADDLDNALLVDYLIRRGPSIIDAAGEFEMSEISIDDDGSLKGFGMDDWDPAMLAALQHALDDDAALVLGDYLGEDVVLGELPEPPGGIDPDEWAELYLARQQEWRRYSAEKMLDLLDSYGERGFYSADLYDGLLDQYDRVESDPLSDALLIALTQSGLHGPIPIYEMTGWDKFKGVVDDAADIATWVSTGALLVPGGQVPAGIVRTAAGLVILGTSVDIADACVVNEDKGNCTQEVVLAGIDGITAGKIRMIRRHFLLDGVLDASEKRILRGLEASAGISGSSLDAITDGDPTYEVDSHRVVPR